MVNLLDKKVRGPEVQPEGQVRRGFSLGGRVLATGGHEAGKWVPTASQGRCSKALGQQGAPRLTGTVVDTIGATCDPPGELFPSSPARMDSATRHASMDAVLLKMILKKKRWPKAASRIPRRSRN